MQMQTWRSETAIFWEPEPVAWLRLMADDLLQEGAKAKASQPLIQGTTRLRLRLRLRLRRTMV
jgi:hypothetical protein